MYNKVPYSQQVPVYFRKITRISIRESALKNVIFSVIIGLIVGAVCPKPLSTAGVFIMVSGCIWLGIFNTIQSICKEHDIINSEFRQGMNIGAFVTSHVLFQAVLCLAQSLLIFVFTAVFGIFENVDGGKIFLIILFFYILTFGSAVLGLMISSIAPNPTTAMTIMPFVLIIQLLLGDWPIDLTGFAQAFTYITFSRWGISAVTLYSNALHDQRSLFEDTALNNVGGIFISLLLIAAFAVISYVALKIRNRDS